MSRRRAFTLVELITVITLITLVTALGVQGLSGGTSAARMRQCLVQTTALLSQARILAMSQNTYVYVFFRPDPDRRRVDAMMVYSRSGLNAWRNAAGPVAAVSDEVAPAHAAVSLDDVRLLDRTAIPSTGDGAIDRPQPAFVMDLGSNYQLSHQGKTYDRCLVFRPTGEVYIPPLAYTGVVEFGLEPARGAVTTSASPLAAVVQVVGATGQTRVYQRDVTR